MKLLGLTAVLLFGFSSAAWAKDSAEYAHCVEKADMVTSDMYQCTLDEISRHDKRLNAVYQELMAKLPAAQRNELRRQQRAWLRGLKHDAQIEYTRSGGTMDLLNGSGLELTRISERADELERRLQRLR